MVYLQILRCDDSFDIQIPSLLPTTDCAALVLQPGPLHLFFSRICGIHRLTQRAFFSSQQPELPSLPIAGMLYRLLTEYILHTVHNSLGLG